jgi:NADH-quinone oxidoreductase subunit B
MTGGHGEGFAVWSSLNYLINLPRKHSLWYLLFSPACCAIELMQAGGPRTDLDRFGMVFRATPRQSDLMIVGGTVTYKMAERIRLLYEQMAEPKYVISMGSCANCGGPFQKSYSVLKGIDMVLPVDIYIPGCPPRPEALANGMIRLQEIMQREDWRRKLRPSRDPAPQMGRGGVIVRQG